MSEPDGHAPRHWNLLSEADQSVYLRISAALCAPSLRNRRSKRTVDFKDLLDAIEVFENFNDSDRWKRCLVCGVCRVNHGIAVNVSQLKRLVFKCKSSINGALKELGYTLILDNTSLCRDLLEAIPYLRENPPELRQWTVRFLPCAALPERHLRSAVPGGAALTPTSLFDYIPFGPPTGRRQQI
jgi:hypothetical protein